MIKKCVFIFSVLFLFSCNNENEILVEKEAELENVSFTIKENEPNKIVNINGVEIEFITNQDDESVSTRAGVDWVGPFYSTNPTSSRVKKNQKVLLRKDFPVGVYICDVISYSKKIDLGQNVYSIKVDVSDVSKFAYANYSTQERGVSVSTAYTSSGLSVYLTYYTLQIISNMAGASYGGQEVPRRGGSIVIPYMVLKDI